MVMIDKSKRQKLTSTTMKSVEAATDAAMDALIADQNPDGHWRYDLETFVFTPAYHIMTLFYINEKFAPGVLEKIGRNIRGHQVSTGGWGYVPHEEPCVSLSVICYFALRLVGDQPNEPHMVLARKAILKMGGAERVNILTRYYLALFGYIPWSCVPSAPVELMLLPDWFPFTAFKIAFWARIILIPVMVLQALNINKRQPKHPAGFKLDEIFLGKPADMKMQPRLPHMNRVLFTLFDIGDRILKLLIPYIPSSIRAKAMATAMAYIQERINGVDGYSSIIPCMHFVLMIFEDLDYPKDHPDYVADREALNRFVAVREHDAYTVSCFPVTWDTVNVLEALLESGESRALAAAEKAIEYFRPRQILDVKGDWAKSRPNLRPGGWCFFYRNPHFPDGEDSACVTHRMYQLGKITGSNKDAYAIERGMEWVVGMQSQNGGWGAYDADNTYYYLDNIPMAADCGSFLDPPTTDVTSSIVSCLAGMGHTLENSECLRKAVQFILSMQKPNGSWYGRWAINYIYGTKQALIALAAAGTPLDHPSITRGVSWLLTVQNVDGGWGEGIVSYDPNRTEHLTVPSTPTQTAWAVAGLLAGLADPRHPAIMSGIEHLLKTQRDDGLWFEEAYTATGHPDMIICSYHGYPKYFPLQTLIKYKNKMKSINELEI